MKLNFDEDSQTPDLEWIMMYIKERKKKRKRKERTTH